MEHLQMLLRKLPKVDEVLQDEHLFLLYEDMPRPLILEAVREIIDDFRAGILNGSIAAAPSQEEVAELVLQSIGSKQKKVLRRVLNATGVVLHTNLGRARLSDAATEAVAEIADSYCTLEYNLVSGSRGSRHDIVEGIVKRVTGAEAAMVVNNNAAATILVLASLARGKEVVVSRGELVEIGGSFRIPDVMSESGAVLREVGATNKTKISDYRSAYEADHTALFMKVHTSNYRIIGFTQEVSLAEMAELGKELSVPVVYDMGSGLMVDLKRYGIHEPTVTDALNAGADVVLFSGDKLLGGPQGGIIAGKKSYIDQMKKHPLARAFRVDKMTLAALEATFMQYIDKEKSLKEIPVLRMLSAGPEELEERANRLKVMLLAGCPQFQYEVESCIDQVGGGSAPMDSLPGFAVAVSRYGFHANKLEEQLREAPIPVIARIHHDKVLLDVRTLEDEEFSLVVDAFSFAEGGDL